MTSEQRRITLGVCLIVGISLLMVAGLTFLIEPMADDLKFSDALVVDILAVPSVAALIAVFAAGQLGIRFGHRRVIAFCAASFSLGAGVLAIAGSALTVEIGLAICAGAAITMQIVGVGLLQHSTGQGKAQTSAFTTYGMVFPLAFLVFPVGTAGVLELTSWRLVPVLWIVGGLLMLAIAFYFLDGNTTAAHDQDWTAPILAGITLAALARALAEVGQVETDPVTVISGFVVGGVVALLFVTTMRRKMTLYSFFNPIRGGMLRVLLLCVALVSLVGLVTFVSIALEFFYEMTPYEAAIAIIPAQIGAVLGAKVLASHMIHRFGGIRAARHLMLTLAVSMLPLLMVTSQTSILILIAIAAIFSFAGMAALTVLNTQVMRLAPADCAGPVSAFRTAASSVGAALGVGILGAIVMSSVHIDEGVSGVSGAQIEHLASSLRIDGVIACLIAIVGWIALSIAERKATKIQAAMVTVGD
jgi:DHA2 family multidrug resistance protein-like MFS transporter